MKKIITTLLGVSLIFGTADAINNEQKIDAVNPTIDDQTPMPITEEPIIYLPSEPKIPFKDQPKKDFEYIFGPEQFLEHIKPTFLSEEEANHYCDYYRNDRDFCRHAQVFDGYGKGALWISDLNGDGKITKKDYKIFSTVRGSGTLGHTNIEGDLFSIVNREGKLYNLNDMLTYAYDFVKPEENIRIDGKNRIAFFKLKKKNHGYHDLYVHGSYYQFNGSVYQYKYYCNYDPLPEEKTIEEWQFDIDHPNFSEYLFVPKRTYYCHKN
jgi:hypothetical protein